MKSEKLHKKAYNIAGLRRMAKRQLPRMVFDFIDGGAEDEITLQRNTSAFANIQLLPRMLRATPHRDQRTRLFDSELTLPVIVPPTGLSGMLWPYGELEVARACAAAGTLMCVSHGSTCSLEEIADASDAPKWFQVFPYKDRNMTGSLAERAKSAGYQALILTVDCQVHGQRERDLANGFSVPPQVTLKNGIDTALRVGWLWRMRQTPKLSFKNYEPYYDNASIMSLGAYMASIVDPAIDWDYVRWLRGLWDGPLLLKGILHPDDARQALESGVDGLFVSNHGGRQLDGAPAPIETLSAVAEAVGDRAVLLLDGGIRRGSDVVKTLALGADAVAIGRPQLWGLAAAGQVGVEWAIEVLRREIDRVLALGGWDSIKELNADCIQFSSPA